MKICLIIFDGLGDRPLFELEGRTPLEAASTPYLDSLASHGICGLMQPIAPGTPVGSDTGHLALLSYDPYATYTGRGPFEAVGIGMEVKPGDIAFRVNLATLKDGIVVDRRAGRIKEGTAELLKSLQGREIEGVHFFLQPSVEHRAALVLRGEGLGDQVSDLDPHKTGLPVQPCIGKDEASNKTARVLNAFFQEALKLLSRHPLNQEREGKGKLPANALLVRGAGKAPQIPLLKEKFGLKSACVAETGLVRGVARYVGMDVVTPDGATGGVDTHCESLIQETAQKLADYDFVLLNYKAPDIAGHDGDGKLKTMLIEKADKALAMLSEAINQTEILLAVTGDHSTPCMLKEHSGDPLPILMHGRGVRKDSVVSFGERSCADSGGLGTIHARDILPILLDLAGQREKFGA